MANLDGGHHEQPGALIPSDRDSWQPILQASNQVVLYNPTSHALSVDWSAKVHVPTRHSCPYCKQTLPPNFSGRDEEEDKENWDWDSAHQARASNYFHLLELSNETSSRPGSPPLVDVDGTSSSRNNGRGAFSTEAMAEGYFKAFFQEEYKLGMGANGSVFLCQHVLDGTSLGHFAVKKIAVGESHSYLLRILREVRLLEQMRHPNIITYHHAWLETCQFSQFGPKVPTLHILMQWAEGGSLDDFIDVRLGRPTKHIHVNPLTHSSTRGPSLSSEPGTPTSVISPLPTPQDNDDIGVPDIHSRSARIRAFRAFQRASPEERECMQREMEGGNGVRRRGPSWKAIHLLGAEEVKSLFGDVAEGLAFLHEKSILHLDLKPGNVLLTWDKGKLIPRAMLSDFGTSRDMMNTARVRSGNTGTLEYSSPESLPSPETGFLRQIDSKADMWSLGMILYKMLFFRLPYRYAAEGDANGEPVSTHDETEKLGRLEKEVLTYPGFKSSPTMVTAFEARRLPRSFLILLESLLNIVPSSRPSVERVSTALREGKFNPQDTQRRSFMMPVVRRQSTSPDLAGQRAPEVRPDLHNATGGDKQRSLPVTSEPVDGEEERQRQVFITEMMRERVKLLGPPEGIGADPDRPAPEIWRVLLRRWARASRVWVRARANVTKEVYMRMVKSCILVIKVFTISHLCTRNNLKGEDATYIPRVASLLGLALLDSVSDDMWLSAILVLAHVVLLRIACGGFY
ncbi:hypothetical protein AX15_002685 [Amanita polypyramis BW_CC]|nr:hypothetical protein AX15_002685 [Amanita polypyramis BW_CC]